MQIGVAVVGMPRGMVVVELMVGGVILLEKEFGVPVAVVPVAVRDDAAVADEEEVVDETVAPRIDVGDERGDGGGVDALGLGGGDGPRRAGPGGGGLLGGEGGWGEREEGGRE